MDKIGEVAVPQWFKAAGVMKESRVKKFGDAAVGWMPPIAMALRGESIEAVAVAPSVDMELGLYAALELRLGFDADSVVFISETFVKPQQTAPLLLLRGQLQHEFGDKDHSVEEALCGVRVYRDETPPDFCHMRFEVIDNTVHWLEPDSDGISARNMDWENGIVMSALIGVMSCDPMSARKEIIARAHRHGWDDEELRMVCGQAALRTLKASGFSMAWKVATEEPTPV